jgi:hypothetical protein
LTTIPTQIPLKSKGVRRNTMKTEIETPDLQPLIIPCDCGSPDAVWRGNKCNLRMYVCEDCAKLYPELNTEN